MMQGTAAAVLQSVAQLKVRDDTRVNRASAGAVHTLPTRKVRHRAAAPPPRAVHAALALLGLLPAQALADVAPPPPVPPWAPHASNMILLAGCVLLANGILLLLIAVRWGLGKLKGAGASATRRPVWASDAVLVVLLSLLIYGLAAGTLYRDSVLRYEDVSRVREDNRRWRESQFEKARMGAPGGQQVERDDAGRRRREMREEFEKGWREGVK